MRRPRNILEDVMRYRGYEIDYDKREHTYVVSSDLDDDTCTKHAVKSIEEGIIFINDVLLDTSTLPFLSIPFNDKPQSEHVVIIRLM